MSHQGAPEDILLALSGINVSCMNNTLRDLADKKAKIIFYIMSSFILLKVSVVTDVIKIFWEKKKRTVIHSLLCFFLRKG